MSSTGASTRPATPTPEDAPLGIAQVAALSGLSQDTLRWYEREGLLPRVRRGSDRRRRYTAREAALVVVLAKLRGTGMPTEEMRQFSGLIAGGAATHGCRLALLVRHRGRIHARMAELEAGLDALDAKAAHYRDLIEAGLDCTGAPVTPDIAVRQRAATTTDGRPA